MSHLILFLLKQMSYLPLPVMHQIGAICGRLAYHLSPKFARKIRTNLDNSKIYVNYPVLDNLVKQNSAEIVKGALELSIAWCQEPENIAKMVTACTGWEHVEAAIAEKKGLLFITPHLGSYDIAGRYISTRLPFALTAMYRPSKHSWLEPIMQYGRVRGGAKTAPATGAGVRIVMKALKSGEATIILPDQVPGSGEGIWTPFFGKPAYSMTLVSRLAHMPSVAPLLFVGERLANGKGFHLHIQPLSRELNGDKEHDTLIINQEVEDLIRRFPLQYLWSYNRYKHPAGAQEPPSDWVRPE